MKANTGLWGLVLGAVCLFTACSDSQAVNAAPPALSPAPALTMKIKIGQDVFTAELQDSPSARALLERLPFTVTMHELNGNEKYHYLSAPLPAAARPVGRIQSGDLMLFGSDCLVLFYKNFKSAYSYTPLGRIPNPQRLAALANKQDVEVSFSR